MSKLLKYSIETDQTVLLQYADGPSKRVPLNEVGEYVGNDDLKKIQTAVRMRQNFFKRHLPKLSLVAVCGGLISLGGLSQNHQLQQRLNPTTVSQPSASPVESKKNILPTTNTKPASSAVPANQTFTQSAPKANEKTSSELRVKKPNNGRELIEGLLRRQNISQQ